MDQKLTDELRERVRRIQIKHTPTKTVTQAQSGVSRIVLPFDKFREKMMEILLCTPADVVFDIDK